MNKDLAKLLENLANRADVYKIKLTWTQLVQTDNLTDVNVVLPNLEIIKYSKISE